MNPVHPKSGTSPGTRTRTGVSSAAQWAHVLPVGSRLMEFEIIGVVGEGGFGIVYDAFDHTLERRVAIKEYMPSSLATRTKDAATVSVKYEHQQETFEAGLRSFVNEARLLAQFDHPALVKVHRFWEANGTAYMAMPFYEGPTLRIALTQMGAPPDERWLRDLLEPLLDALVLLHGAQCFHRDIAPDNILLTQSGPLLLDFGAARRVISVATQALTVILKPGYAPVEQYGEVASMTQGAWTDIYALCCVVYNAVTGKVPPASVERLIEDRLQPLATVAAGRYSERFLTAIDAGLAVKPQQRPQDIAQLRALLGEGVDDVMRDADVPRTLMRGPVPRPQPTKRRTLRHIVAPPSPSVSAKQPLPRARARTRVVVAVLSVVALVTAVAMMWRGERPSMTTPTVQQTLLSTNAPASTVKAAPAAAVAAVSSSLSSSSSVVVARVTASDNASKANVSPPITTAPARVVNAPRAEPASSASDSTSAQRCREILQKASLEPLAPEDAEFLRRACK